MLRSLLALALGFLVPVWSASAQDRWVLLGARDIESGASEASIDLETTQPVKQLRLVATKGGITLSKVVVSYRDGRTHTEERRINLLAGERTKPIDPREEAGFADRVALVFDGPSKAGGLARLEVWGLAIEKNVAAGDRPERIQGIWEGRYLCGQGATGMAVTISGDDVKQLVARLRFYALPENPRVPSGEYELSGSFDTVLGRVDLRPSKWVSRPAGYDMVGLRGVLESGRQSLKGPLEAPCFSFVLARTR